MSHISTHVLDTAIGEPAAGVTVRFAQRSGPGWRLLAEATTDLDGRIAALYQTDAPLAAGLYRLRFRTEDYFTAQGRPAFYPRVDVVLSLSEGDQRHHIPLLLAPFGYSTYRGS